MLAALREAGSTGSAAEMRRHLDELERCLTPQPTAGAPLRDVFAAYRAEGRTAAQGAPPRLRAPR
jgi:hypothetical protein